jgi:hypothetical protein
MMILTQLLQSVDVTLARITPSHLERYDTLQRSLHTTDVSVDLKYRRMFNGYYRMHRKPKDWYDFFFALLEGEKDNGAITFREVFERVYGEKRRVEPSFCSKLVATIRGDMPVYDKYVRVNLSLVIPRPSERPEARVGKFISVYADLHAKQSQLMLSEQFPKLRRAFDERFDAYTHFTDTKKLDLLLWQYRRGVGGRAEA